MSRFPFPAYPSGWFVVAFSADLPPGGVLTRHYFGQDLVLYRTQEGVARASEPYCPHVGAHLGHGGQVVGETLRCPFHGWCFDGAGTCVSVPGVETPPRVALPQWPVAEQNGVIAVYHDVDPVARRAPPWPFPIFDDSDWSESRTVLWSVRTHPQEVCENTVDIAHLFPVHGVENARVVRAPAVEGHVMTVRLGFDAPGELVGMPGMRNQVELDVALHGLGVISVVTHIMNMGLRARQRLCCTPVDGDRIDLRGMAGVQNLMDEQMTAQMLELFFQAFLRDFVKDFPIWENKRYVERPPLSRADGPFGVLRRYSQGFYGGAAPVLSPASL